MTDQQYIMNDNSPQGVVQRSAQEIVAETIGILPSMGQVADKLRLLYGADIYYVHPVGAAPMPREEALQDLAPVGEQEIMDAYEAASTQFAVERQLLADEVTQATGREVDPNTLKGLDDILPDELKEQVGNEKDADWGIAAAARLAAAFNIPNPDPGLAESVSIPVAAKPSGLKNRLSWAAGFVPRPILKRYVESSEEQTNVPPEDLPQEGMTPWLEPPRIKVNGDDWLKMKKVDSALARMGDPVKALNYINDMLNISKAELIQIMARVTKACREQKIQSPSISQEVGEINNVYIARRDEINEGLEVIARVYDYFFPQG